MKNLTFTETIKLKWELLIERVYDFYISIGELDIFEVARAHERVGLQIIDDSDQAIKNLIGILKWDNGERTDKMLRQIQRSFRAINSMHIRPGRKPLQEEYFEWIMNDHGANSKAIEWKIGLMTSAYALDNPIPLPEIRADDEVYPAMVEIMTRVSRDMANNTYTSIEDYLPKMIY